MSDFDYDLDFDDLDLDDMEVPVDVPELETMEDLPVPQGVIDVNKIDPNQIHFGSNDDMVSKTSPTTTASTDDLIIGANREGSTSPSEHIAGRDEFKPL